MAAKRSVEVFIAKNKTPIVTAKRLGLGAIVGIQQAGLEELDARNPNRQPSDFLALQNLIPIVETAILIPASILPKSNTARVIFADLLVGTTAMAVYRIAKMATPLIANRMRSLNAKNLKRGSAPSGGESHGKSVGINPMSIGMFSMTP